MTYVDVATTYPKASSRPFPWPSRAVRDEGMKRAMADPRLKSAVDPALLDGKRMIFGGFEVMVSA